MTGGPGQCCPICHRDVDANPRYPRYVCQHCAARAATADGRLLTFHNNDASGGYLAFHVDTGEVYPSHVCYVDGVACLADEARFGGIVIQPA